MQILLNKQHPVSWLLHQYPSLVASLPSCATARSKERKDPTNDGTWINHGHYWLNAAEQGSETWHSIRHRRLTGANVGIAIGAESYPDSNPRILALELVGLYKREFKPYSIYIMSQGTQYEPHNRAYYCSVSGYYVREVGICIPHSDLRRGASLDGEVWTHDPHTPGAVLLGNFEAKCPQRMYPKLLEHARAIEQGKKFDLLYHDHIKPGHYIQMQYGLMITQRPWCDYSVYGITDGLRYIQRVYYNQEYCRTVINPGVERFFAEEVDPLLLAISAAA